MLGLPLLLIQSVALVEFSVRAWDSSPEMTVQDAYKWLFHATMGGEHAITNEEGVRAWMAREWEGLDLSFDPTEPEFTALDPFGMTYRWNLRPAKRRGEAQEVVLKAFLESASRFQSHRESFVMAWELLGGKIQTRSESRWSYDDWVQLDASTRASGYPALHHSGTYEKARVPAYRVIVRTAYPRAGQVGE